MDYDLQDIAKYAVAVFAPKVGEFTSRGVDIAYAALKAATGGELTPLEQELVDRFVIDGKIRI